MKFAYHSTMCPAQQYLPLAQAAERVGFDTFTLPDSICYPQQASSKYPYNDDGSREFLDDVPFLDPFALISAMASVTSHLRFSTSVLKLAIRQPVVTAKQASTAAILSNNRFAFGVGISPWREDFDACQVAWDKRGKRMDEMIEIIQGLMSGDYFGYEGEIFQLDPIKLCPAPSAPVPILIGGHSTPALKRAARLCDGFIHAGGDAQVVKQTVRQVNEYREHYGRGHLPFEFQAISADGFSLEGVQNLHEAGVDEVIVGFRDVYSMEPDTKSIEEKVAELEWYAENIIQPWRAMSADKTHTKVCA